MIVSKVFYGVTLVLLLIFFSLPWYSTTTNGSWLGEVHPSVFERYFIGSKPYTGWSVLPLTAPSLVGFILGALVLFTKRRPAIAPASGILMLIGVAIGLARAQSVQSSQFSNSLTVNTITFNLRLSNVPCLLRMRKQHTVSSSFQLSVQ